MKHSNHRGEHQQVARPSTNNPVCVQEIQSSLRIPKKSSSFSRLAWGAVFWTALALFPGIALAQDVAVSPTRLSVLEGGSAEYTVRLTRQPTADVTIGVERSTVRDYSDDSLTAEPDKLTFTVENWDAPQTVTISAAEDLDGENGSGGFNHNVQSTDSNYDGIQISGALATEVDNDPVGVTVSPLTLLVLEGGSNEYTVRLDTEPVNNVSLYVLSRPTNDSDLTAPSSRYTFTKENWNIPRAIRITAIEDSDKLDGVAVFDHVLEGDDPSYNDDVITAIDSVTATEADNDKLTLTIQTDASAPVSGAFEVEIVFSDSVSGFTLADIDVSNGRASNFKEINSRTYTATITPQATGKVKVDVEAGVATDSAENSNKAAESLVIEADLTGPTAAITSAASEPVSGAFEVNIVFDETVTGFEQSDITVTNGTVTDFSVLETSYTAEITPAESGRVYVKIDANVVEDAAGNGNRVGKNFVIEADLTRPTLSITNANQQLVVGAFRTIIRFSEDVSGFTLADIDVSNGTASEFEKNSSNSYVVTITPQATGEVKVDVEANVATDDAGNGNEAAESLVIEADLTNPAVAITSAASEPVSGAFEVIIAFSEAVTGFEQGDITVTNGSVTDFNGSELRYTAEITPSDSGEVTISIDADQAEDEAGNGNEAAEDFVVDADLTDPTLAITSAAAGPVSGAFEVNIVFDEAVTGFEQSDITVTNATVTDFSGSEADYTAEITPSGSGRVLLRIGANAAEDAAGNGNAASEVFVIEADLTRPTVAITSGATEPVEGAFVVNIIFSEAVTGFEQGDITVTNGAATDFSGSGRSYKVEITPAAAGEVTVRVNADQAEDAAGNGNEKSEEIIIEADPAGPTVAITSAASGPVSGAFEVNITFSEAIIGFGQSNIAVTNGAVTDFSGSGANYKAEITPSQSGEVTVIVDMDEFVIEADLTDPTLAITSAAAEPVSGAFDVNIVFDETVTGFEQSDITVTNGSVTDFSGSGRSYTAEITPSESGDVTVSIGADQAEDAAGNGNAAAEDFVIEADLTDSEDETNPTLVIETEASSPVGGAFEARIRFSENVSGFTLADIDVSNGTASNFKEISSRTYTATITPQATGEVKVDVEANVVVDDANNGNEAAESLVIEADLTRPTVAITSEATGPVSGPFEVNIVFDETVTGFEQSDITVENGAVTDFSGSEAKYTAEITPSGSGRVLVKIDALTVEDAAGNGNRVSGGFDIEADLTNPTLAITSAAAEPLSGAFELNITFDEAVIGFEQGDITVTNGSVTDFSGSETSYTAEITPSDSGEVTVSIGADQAEDAAGNGNEAAEDFVIEADLTDSEDEIGPRTKILTEASSPVGGAFGVAITFSQIVDGFTVDDIGVRNGTISEFKEISTQIYTITITPQATGEVRVDVEADVATDGGDKGNEAAETLIIEADLTNPTVAITSAAAEPVSGAFEVDITFDEAVTGFEQSEITVANGAVTDFSGSGRSYTAEITPSESGDVTVSIGADQAEDAAGNGNEAAEDFLIEADLTDSEDEIGPRTKILTEASSPVGGAFGVAITFSQIVDGFTVDDIGVRNGTISEFKEISTQIYTITITPQATGEVRVDVEADVATDGAGRGNEAAETLIVEADLTNPTLAITSEAAEPVIGAFEVNIVFDEAVTGFEQGDITVRNGAVTDFSGSEANYTAEIAPAGSGVVAVSVDANQAEDAAGNGNEAAETLIVEADLTNPTLAITSAAAEPVSDAFEVNITFSEAVTGFERREITVTNGAVTDFSGSETNYTAEITPAETGEVTVSIDADQVKDAAGNGNEASREFVIEADLTRPTLAITSAAAEPVSGAFEVDITFNEAVTGFKRREITVTNGAVTDFNGSDTNYTAEITPWGSGAVIVSVDANQAEDAAGNGNEAAEDFIIDADLTNSEDTFRPTLEIQTTSSGPVSGPFPVAIFFSEIVDGFTIEDIDVRNGTVLEFEQRSSQAYTIAVMPEATGEVSVDVKRNVATDSGDNGNKSAESLVIEADLTRPALTIASEAVGPVGGAFEVNIVFDEAVIGFEQSDVQVTNGSVTRFSGSQTNYTAWIAPSRSGAVTVSVAADAAEDAAGNGNEAAADFIVEADLTGPTLEIASEASEPVTGTFVVSIVFDEAVTGFEQSDVQVSNGSVVGFSGSEQNYTARIAPSLSGAVTISVAADAAEDAVGNGNEAAADLVVESDLTNPVTTITSEATGPVAGAFTATIRFSEIVFGFTLTDIEVSNGAVSNFGRNSLREYTITVTPEATGEVKLEVAANVARDSAGNDNAAAEAFVIEADLTGPTVAISSEAAGPVSGAFTATIVFSKPVTGFEQSDLQVSNGTVDGVDGSGTNYIARITPAESGEVTVSIAADRVEDAAGNGNAAAADFVIEADLTIPTVAISSEAAGPVAGAFTATIVFSEPVTGFEQSDLQVSNGAVDGVDGSGTNYIARIAPAESGEVTVSIAADRVEDAAGNGNAASEVFVIEADLTGPTVAISSEAAGPVSGVFTATIVFSEPVTGFEQSDLQVSNGAVDGLDGSGANYIARITPAESGEVTVSIAADRVEDAAGNGNQAAEAFVIEVDLTSPTVAISSEAAGPVSGVFTATIVFSEPVTGFEQSDLQVSNGAVDGVDGSGTNYIARIAPAESGPVTVSIAADMAADAAGNGNESSEPFVIEADLERPRVTVTGPADPVVAGAGEFEVTIAFSEPVQGFAREDIQLGNATVTDFITASSLVYRAMIDPAAPGQPVVVEIPEDVAADLAGNGNQAAEPLQVETKLVVSFGESDYTAIEGGEAAAVTLTLSQAANQALAIPIRLTRPETTTVDDYAVEGLRDWDAEAGVGTLGVPAGATEQAFRIIANLDEDGDDETLELGFGDLPEVAMAGESAAATVTLKDKGLVDLQVSFGQSNYTVTEGERGEIEVTMSPAADRTVDVPLRVTLEGGATLEDYSGIPSSLVFERGESRRMVSLAVAMDEAHDPGEGIVLHLGELPEAVSTGDPASVQVRFDQRRTAEQFAQTQEALLAVVGRSMGESALTAIESRFERHRQWGRLQAVADEPLLLGDNAGAAPGSALPGSLMWSVSARTPANVAGAYPGLGKAPGVAAYGQEPGSGSGLEGALPGTAAGNGNPGRDLSAAGFEIPLDLREQKRNWTPVLWGQGDMQQFNGDLERLGTDYKGGLDAAHVGLDLYTDERLLAGLSFMRSWGDLDYSDDGTDGLLRSRMDTAHPYLYWQPNERVGVWGVGGFGAGDVGLEELGRAHDFDADFRMYAGGVRALLSRRGDNEWGVRADVLSTRLATDASADIAGVSGEARRGRLMLEWIHDESLSAGRSLRLKVEAGGRFDGGDADRGAGMETGFRVAYLDANSGLDVSLHGRVLLVHESGYRDWGAGIQANWDPGLKRRGFRASIASSWGRDGDGRTTLWDNADAITGPVGALAQGSRLRMESEVAYAGLRTPGLPGLFTPYSRLRWTGRGRELAWGTSWNLVANGQSTLPFTLELEGVKRANATGQSDYGVLLRLSIPL